MKITEDKEGNYQKYLSNRQVFLWVYRRNIRLPVQDVGKHGVTVSLGRQKDKLRNSSRNPTYLFKNT